ncbi:MAG TPA: pilus assembly protein TadG-related protein [Pyrinomonadaceae bacterium]|nr:pilus assembly protein TadG-related protein [Pyrinomonadaceae bacterium]
MKHRSVEQKGARKQERGSILATSAIGMLAILLAVGLGVDISRFYLVKAELQNGADAAALAAVSVLNGAPTGIDKAVQEATVNTINKYDFNNTGIVITNVEFSASLNGGYMPAVAARATGTAPNIRFVRVTTEPSPVAVSFAAVVLGKSKDLTATATAGYSVGLTDICNFLPVMVIDYGTPIVPTQTYTFRAEGGSFVSPGNYQILAIAGSGGADARVGLGAGVDACAGPGAVYSIDTKPGVTAGAVRAGVNTRFDDYSTSQVNPQEHPPDLNIKEGITYDDYKAAAPGTTNFKEPTHTGMDRRRVVYIPIVKESEFDPGRNVVKFDRIGQFFLRNKVGNGSGGDLVAEYIDDPVIGIGTVGTGGGGSPLMVTPVLYK